MNSVITYLETTLGRQLPAQYHVAITDFDSILASTLSRYSEFADFDHALLINGGATKGQDAISVILFMDHNYVPRMVEFCLYAKDQEPDVYHCVNLNGLDDIYNVVTIIQLLRLLEDWVRYPALVPYISKIDGVETSYGKWEPFIHRSSFGMGLLGFCIATPNATAEQYIEYRGAHMFSWIPNTRPANDSLPYSVYGLLRALRFLNEDINQTKVNGIDVDYLIDLLYINTSLPKYPDRVEHLKQAIQRMSGSEFESVAQQTRAAL